MKSNDQGFTYHLKYSCSHEIQQFIEIAIRVLQYKDLETIQRLKALLRLIPNPNLQKETLAAASLVLIASDLETTHWLLQNSDILLPDLNIPILLNQFLSDRLIDLEVDPQDFKFDKDTNLLVSTEVKKQILSRLTPTEGDNFYALMRSRLF